MNWQGLSVILPLLISGTVSISTAIYSPRLRATPKAPSFFLVGLMSAVWSFAYFLEIIAPDISTKILWANVKSVGMIFLPLSILLLSLQYTRRQSWLMALVRILTWASASVLLLIIWTDGSLGTYRLGPSLINHGSLLFLDFHYGLWFWIQTAYCYLLITAGMITLFRELSNRTGVYRGEILSLIPALYVPWLVHAINLVSHVTNGYYDLTPIFMGLGNLVIAWAIYHYRILDIIPAALNVVVEMTVGGVVVIDENHKIIEINPTALKIFNTNSNHVIGTHISMLPGLKTINYKAEAWTEEIAIVTQEVPHYYEIRSSPLRDRTGSLIGWILLLSDITERKHEDLKIQEDDRLTKTILSVGAELAKSLDFNQVLDLILEQVKPIVPYDAASVMLVEDQYAIPTRERGYEPFGQEGLKVIRELNIEIASVANLRYMMETRKPLFLADTERDSNWVSFGVTEHFHSWVGAPIISGGKVIAFLSLNKSEPNFYSDQDASHLAIFANQTSMAIENAHIYTEAQQRITEQSILNEIGRTLSSYLDLDELLKSVHQQVGRLFDASNFMVVVYDKDADEWSSVYMVDQSDQNLSLYGKISQGLSGHIIQKRQPLLFRNLGELLVFEAQTGVKSLGKDPKSWMGVPLISADMVVGVMAIENFEKQDLYGEKELAIFSTIGASVAIAIENAHLYKDMQKRTIDLAEANKAALEARALSEALRHAGEALSTTLDFDVVLDLILEQIKHIIPHDAANIYLVEGNEVKPIRLEGYDSYNATLLKQLPNIPLIINETPNIKQLIETKQPLLIPDTDKFTGWVKGKTYGRIHSWVGAPLVSRDQVIGLISLIKTTKAGFTQNHAEILEIFAGQAALAMENARLFEEVQRFAITDALSGLYNRTYFSEQMNRLEQGRHYPVSILVADIDNLKETNDSLGHAAGDELIRQTARLFNSAVRVEDTIARIGGDEFAVLLPDTDTEKARHILKRIKEKMHEFNKNQSGPPLWLSMGIASGTQNHPLSEVLKDADNHMYRNKKTRKTAKATN